MSQKEQDLVRERHRRLIEYFQNKNNLNLQLASLKAFETNTAMNADDFLAKLSAIDCTKSSIATVFRDQAQFLVRMKGDILPGRESVWSSSAAALRAAVASAQNNQGYLTTHFFEMSHDLLTYSVSTSGFSDLSSSFASTSQDAQNYHQLSTGKDLEKGEDLLGGARAMAGAQFFIGTDASSQIKMKELGIDGILAVESILKKSSNDSIFLANVTAAASVAKTMINLEELNTELGQAKTASRSPASIQEDKIIENTNDEGGVLGGPTTTGGGTPFGKTVEIEVIGKPTMQTGLRGARNSNIGITETKEDLSPLVVKISNFKAASVDELKTAINAVSKEKSPIINEIIKNNPENLGGYVKR